MKDCIIVKIIIVFSLILSLKAHSFCGYHHSRDQNLGIVNLEVESSAEQNLTFLESNDDEWEPIRIYMDFAMLDNQAKGSITQFVVRLKSMIQDATNVFQTLINVKRLKTPLKLKNSSCTEITLSQTVKTIGVNADIVIVPYIDFSHPSGVVAAASACDIDQKNYRPILGTIGFNPNIDNDFKMKSSYDTIIMATIHELTHVFVFSPNLFSYFIDSKGNRLKDSDVIGKKKINGNTVTIIKTPKVRQKAGEHFGCKNVEGVEVENHGGQGTVGAHWETRLMLGDYMVGKLYEDMFISEITLALFEDSGWYKVNNYTGGLFRFGKNAGCSIFERKCIEFGKTSFQNEYCVTKNQGMCTAGRFSKGYCEINTYSSNIPSYWQYFTDPRKGGEQNSDFCPISTTFVSNNNKKFNSCITGDYYYPQEMGLKEYIGKDSACFMSSLTPVGKPEYDFGFEYKNKNFPVCYKFSCDHVLNRISVTVGNITQSCPREGGNITFKGFDGLLRCPEYNLLCTTKTYCTDAVDCVKKKAVMIKPVYDDSVKINYNSQSTNDVSIMAYLFNLS